MLFKFLEKNKIILSLGFCILFSLVSLLWYNTLLSKLVARAIHSTDKRIAHVDPSIAFAKTQGIDELSDGDKLAKHDALREQYEKLRKKLEQYKTFKERFDFISKQNSQLREILNFKKTTDFPEIQARVLGVRLSGLSPRVLIERGSRDGVKPLMPVIIHMQDEGQHFVRSVVGTVVFVDANTAVVKPLIHPNFNLGVRIQASREWAILSGDSPQHNLVKLNYIHMEIDELLKENKQAQSPEILQSLVHTSGLAGIFPPGILIGRIVKLGKAQGKFKTAYVLPYTKWNQLDYVSVILKEVEDWSGHMQTAQAEEESRAQIEHYLKTEFTQSFIYLNASETPEAKPSQQRKVAKAQERTPPSQKQAAILQEAKLSELGIESEVQKNTIKHRRLRKVERE